MELENIYKFTKNTFDFYNDALKLYNNKYFEDSGQQFCKVIFNLYNIKKLLNELNLNSEELKKKKIDIDNMYNKVDNILTKSYNYAYEIDLLNKNDNNSDDEIETQINISNKQINKDDQIFECAKEGDIIKFENLLKEYDNINYTTINSLGETPFHISVRNGDTRMTELFLQTGADINSVTSYGLTSIEIACINHDFTMISVLQDYGCKIDKFINLRKDSNNNPKLLKSSNIDLILIIKKLINLITPFKISKVDCFIQFKSILINYSIKTSRKIRILKSIDKIESSKIKIGWDNLDLSDIFHLVWNTIKSEYYIESFDDIIKILIEELYYCYNQNNNLVVCPSNIYERLIYSLAGFRPDLLNINLDSVLNQELISYAENLKKKKLSEDTGDIKEYFNSSIYTKEQQDNIKIFNIKFKKLLIEEFSKIYVDTNILQKKELLMKINKWINLV